MAITTLDGLIAAAKQVVPWTKTASVTTVAAQPSTYWDVAGNPGAGTIAIGNTTTGVVPTGSTGGFPALFTFGGGATGYLNSVGYTNSVASRVTLYDRIWHAGSFPATPTGTTSLTTTFADYSGRLPGGSAHGVEAFLEINVQLAASAVTIQLGYTNSDGVGSRLSVATASLSGFVTRRLVPIQLQAGDRGIQKIDSYIIGGTAAATGSINLVLARRLWTGRVNIANAGGYDGPDVTGLPIIYQNTAFWPVVIADSTAGGLPDLTLNVANG